MTAFIIRFRWIIICASLLTGVIFAAVIPLSRTDPEIRNYVPQSMASRIATDKIESEFGVQDMIIVLFSDSSVIIPENLKRIRDIDRGISRVSGISNRISPFTIKVISGDSGVMTAENLIKEIPVNETDIQELRRSILKNRFARDIVFSSDMTTASLTATISKDEREDLTLSRIDSVISSNPGKATILTGGLPYIRHYIMRDVRRDAIYLVPAALLIMLLILKITLGEWKSVFMPFTVVVLSTSISMGLIPVFGWKISILSLLVPIIIVAVANNYGIYLVARHQEISRNIIGSKESILQMLTGSLNVPILFSGLTTIAGILGLLTHSIIPARQVGVLSAIGVTMALIMSLTFIPALIYLKKLPIKKTNQQIIRKGFFDKSISVLARIIIHNPVRILLVSLFLTIIISAGIIFLRIDTNQENYFPKKHPIRSASGIINNKFGGSQTISVMIDGDIKDPEVMNRIDKLTLQLEKTNGVGGVFSISQVIREMTKAIYTSGETEYDNIPVSREGIAQLFELYNMNGSPDDFKQLLNSDNTKAHILLRISDPQTNVIDKIRTEISELTKNFPAKVTIGGYAIIMSDFAASIIKGQVSSLVFAVVTVFLLLAIVFKSVKGGLVGSIPLAGSILVVFGFMGISGIALDAATALLSSIMIGVGVDFTIQYMWCFNTQLRKGIGYEEATANALGTIGRSIIINAMSVMAGFSALMLSGFTSIRFFGYLVFISIGSCLVGAIILIPAFLIVLKPAFISADLTNRKNRKYEKKNNILGIPSVAFKGSSSAT